MKKALLVMLSVLLAVSAVFAGGAKEGSSDGSLRFMWWGGDARNAATVDVINKYMEVESITLEQKVYDDFIRWIETVRDSYQHENTDIYISSRRIQYILKMYKMTGNFQKSMQVVLSRYQDSEVDAFMKVWKAIAG